MDPSSDLKSDCAATANKPKIWSLADTAACKTPPPQSHLPPGHHLHNSHHLGGGHHPLGHHPHHQNPNSHHHPHHAAHPNSNHASAAAMSHHQAAAAAAAPPVTSSWSFALPPAYRYGGFLPPSVANNEGVGTDTPPQTPPNLKVPLLSGSLSHFQSGAGNSSALNPSGDLSATAFKPVLKR